MDAYTLGLAIPEYRKTEESTVQTKWEVTEMFGTSHSAPLIAALAVTIALYEDGLDPKSLKMRVLEHRDSAGYIDLKALALSR